MGCGGAASAAFVRGGRRSGGCCMHGEEERKIEKTRDVHPAEPGRVADETRSTVPSDPCFF